MPGVQVDRFVAIRASRASKHFNPGLSLIFEHMAPGRLLSYLMFNPERISLNVRVEVDYRYYLLLRIFI